MSEDESNASEAEGSGTEERNEGGSLLSANTANQEVVLNSPLSIRNITYWNIVDPGHTFQYHLDANNRHQVTMYAYAGGTTTVEWLRIDEWTEGWIWHTSKLTNSNLPGPLRLFHMWKYFTQSSGWHEINCFISSLPQIDSHSVYTNAITGSGGDATALSVWLLNGNQLSERVGGVNGRWSIPLSSTVHPGTFNITIEQYVSGYNRRYTASKTITYLASPKINSPAAGAVVKLDTKVEIRGNWGAPNEIIQVMNENGTSNFGQMAARADGTWDVTFDATPHYPAGGWQYFMVRHEKSGNTVWTQLQVFLIAPPVIDAAPLEVEMNARIGGAGHTDLTRPYVDVFFDLSDDSVGTGVVTNGRWGADVRFLTAGPHRLTAVQSHGGVKSERAASRVFHVKPPPPTLTSQRVGDRIELHGTGYTGAQMHVHVSSNSSTPFLETSVSSGSWRVAIPDSTLPATYGFKGRQSVSNGGSGRIYSTGWIAAVSVNIPTPKPTVTTPAVNGLAVTFSGTGRQWGTATVQVVIFKGADSVVANINVPSTFSWRETVTLPPGRYDELYATQWVNSQHSDRVPLDTVVVRSPLPILEKPEPGAVVGQSAQLKGSAYPESIVTFSIPGTAPFTATATSGRFDFAQELPPGTYTMTVAAEFAGQTSDPLTRTFTVKTPMPTISASDGDLYDPRPTIKGEGYKDCWLVIRSADSHRDLGSAPVGPNGDWSVQLPEQPLGPLAFYAVQFERENSPNKSEATETVTVNIRLTPPTILAPNGKTERTSKFSGTALYGSTVQLYLKGQTLPFIKDIVVKQDGTWEQWISLPAGELELEVDVLYRGTPSTKTEHPLTVVPDVPKVDTPLVDQQVGATLTLSGFGVAGDIIIIERRTPDVIMFETPVEPDHTWSAKFKHDMTAGSRMAVMARAGAGLDSTYTHPAQYTLLTPAPKIIEPQSGDWTGVRPLYSGVAEPGATITVASWFDADSLLAAPTVADEDGRWSVWGNKDLPEGATWVVMRQTLGGAVSEWVQSGRFMVERMAANFEAPTVTFPRMGQAVGRWPMFEGGGVPGAEIILYKKGEINTVLGRTGVDRQGAWAVRSLIELAVGDNFEYSVHQTRDGVISKWVLPDRMFHVRVPAGYEELVIDTPRNDPSQVLELQPVFCGRGIPGADVQVVSVRAKTRVNAQGNWSVRSEVLSPAIRYASHAEQFMDGIDYPPTNTVIFKVAEKLELPVIVSPDPGAQIAPYGVIKGTALPGTEVRLVRVGNPYITWGFGVADAQGQWIIVLGGLPVGDFQLTGEGRKDQLLARWIPAFELKVIDAG